MNNSWYIYRGWWSTIISSYKYFFFSHICCLLTENNTYICILKVLSIWFHCCSVLLFVECTFRKVFRIFNFCITIFRQYKCIFKKKHVVVANALLWWVHQHHCESMSSSRWTNGWKAVWFLWWTSALWPVEGDCFLSGETTLVCFIDLRIYFIYIENFPPHLLVCFPFILNSI